MSDSSIAIPGLEGNFRWIEDPVKSRIAHQEVSISSRENTDWFVDPETLHVTSNAPALVRRTRGDFTVSALVDVEFHATFDAGALVMYYDTVHWVKFALECSPQGKGAIVTVITRGESDESLSRVVYDSSLYLRISRLGRTVALHSSLDGQWWDLERYCHFDFPEVDVGFESQSPTGKGTTARFSAITFGTSGVNDFRSGV
jgi:regulation of enolase protein 1 (concanavalin A-like superfamily)